MSRLTLASVLLVVTSSCLTSSCAVYSNGHRTVVAVPEFYGSVTYIDPVMHRIDLDYVDGGRHYTRQVYLDEHTTKWNDVRLAEVRKGDAIWVHGTTDRRGRWHADEVRKH